MPRAYHGLCPIWLAVAALALSLLLGWLVTEYFEKPVARCIVRHTGSRTPHRAAGSSSRHALTDERQFTPLEPEALLITQAASNIRPAVTPPRSAATGNPVAAMLYQQSALQSALEPSHHTAAGLGTRLVRASAPTDQGGADEPVDIVRKRSFTSS